MMLCSLLLNLGFQCSPILQCDVMTIQRSGIPQTRAHIFEQAFLFRSGTKQKNIFEPSLQNQRAAQLLRTSSVMFFGHIHDFTSGLESDRL